MSFNKKTLILKLSIMIYYEENPNLKASTLELWNTLSSVNL